MSTKYHICDVDVHSIEKAGEYCQPVADDRFKMQVKLGYDSRGWPRKVADELVIFLSLRQLFL